MGNSERIFYDLFSSNPPLYDSISSPEKREGKNLPSFHMVHLVLTTRRSVLSPSGLYPAIDLTAGKSTFSILHGCLKSRELCATKHKNILHRIVYTLAISQSEKAEAFSVETSPGEVARRKMTGASGTR